MTTYDAMTAQWQISKILILTSVHWNPFQRDYLADWMVVENVVRMAVVGWVMGFFEVQMVAEVTEVKETA